MILIAGAGVFGLTAALSLRARGHAVTVIDPGPLPRPEGASTDSSRAVRMDYGADEHHTELAARAIEGWKVWNEHAGQALYHADGMLFLTRTAWDEDGFEARSHALLTRRGARVERLDARSIARRYPMFRAGAYVDGYLSHDAGWAQAEHSMAWLAREAHAAGVELRERALLRGLVLSGGRVCGVRLPEGVLEAETVVVAAGAWTPRLVPWLQDLLLPAAQPVVYLAAPGNPERWRAPHLPVWSADISRTGWYGLPATAEGLLKIGFHGCGRRADPDAPRNVDETDLARVRDFLRRDLPDLAQARLVHAKTCLYCDTPDGDFLIDRDPERPGLVVATGGSGHAFKFAPLLGELVADAVEGRSSPYLARYRWRTGTRGAREASRFDGA